MKRASILELFHQKFDKKEILPCIQCGSCSASCPLGHCMDYGPRALFMMIINGDDVNAILSSNTPWYCVSCYHCTTRCPQKIPVVNLMYSIKQMAVESNCYPKNNKMHHFYRSFIDNVTLYGRMTESFMMLKYGLTHPFDVIAKAFVAVKMFKRNRVDIVPQRITNSKQLEYLMKGTFSDNKGDE